MKSFFVKLATVLCLIYASRAIFPLLAFPPLDDDVFGEVMMRITPQWYQLYTIGIMACYIALVGSHINAIIALLISNKSFFLLLAYIMASCLWALDPWLSFIMSCKIISALLFGLFLAARFSSKELLSILSIMMLIIISGSIFFLIFLPDLAQHMGGQWRGAFEHRNMMATVMNIAFVILTLAAIHFKKFKWPYTGFAILSVVMIIISQSGTGIIVLFILALSPLLLPFLRLHWALCLSLMLAAVFLGGIALVSFDLSLPADMILNSLGKESSLTGRTDIWHNFVQAVMEHHWLAGFGSQEIYVTSRGTNCDPG